MLQEDGGGNDISRCHLPRVVAGDHFFSIMTKMILHSTEEQKTIWMKEMRWIVQAALNIAERMPALFMKLLEEHPTVIIATIWPKLLEECRGVETKAKTDTRLSQKLDRRAADAAKRQLGDMNLGEEEEESSDEDESSDNEDE